MRITVPKVVRPLKVAEYAQEFGELVIPVWVNPPRDLLGELIDCLKTVPEETREERAHRAIEIIAELWSQGSDQETHWTADEVITLASETMETDPQFWPWLRERTFDMIGEHRKQEKKS